MSRLTVDPAQLHAAASAGERTAESAHAVAAAVRGAVAPDPGRADGAVLLAEVLRAAADSTRSVALRAGQDAQALRSAALRYAAAERIAAGGAPCG